MKRFALLPSIALGLMLAGCVDTVPHSSAATTPAVPPPPAPALVAAPAVAPTPPAVPPVVATPKPANVEPYRQLPDLDGTGWTSLFDGRTLKGWTPTKFAGGGEVEVKDGNILLPMGAMLTGVNLVATNDIPGYGYELALDAMKVDGSDFFCGLTFVVGENCCSLIVGGWGGGLVGISSLDGNDASSNETTKFKGFESKEWFRIRVRVTKAKLEAWIGAEKVASVETEGRRIGVRPGEIELNQPFGIATYQTTAAIRNVLWRKLN